jgi:hypothetical protein
LRATAFKLVGQVRTLDVNAVAASPKETAAFFAEASATLADLSTQLTLVYFRHSELPTSSGRS